MRFVASILVLIVAACTPPQQGYPPEIELNFRNACEAQSPPDGLCSCVWERIEANVEPGDLVALERLPLNERESHPLTQQINAYAVACQSTDTPLEADDGELPPAP